MKNPKLSVFLSAAILLINGCSARSQQNDLRGPVKRLENGEFLFTFKRHAVFQSNVDNSVAVKNYLETNKPLIPECVRGVSVLRTGDTQDGNGWATFRCL